MRTLFIAIGKVYGLIQVYSGILYTTSMIPAIQATWQVDDSGATAIFMTGSVMAMIILTLGVAWLLLFRTEWLANKLKLPETDSPQVVTGSDILHVGTIILGIYAIIQAFPELAGNLIRLRNSMSSDMMYQSLYPVILARLVTGALKLALGIFLVLGNNWVLNWIDGKRKGISRGGAEAAKE